MPIATAAGALPGEQMVATMALRVSVKSSLDLKNPLPLNDDNLKGGARTCTTAPARCVMAR
jgi:hypothetical protein